MNRLYKLVPVLLFTALLQSKAFSQELTTREFLGNYDKASKDTRDFMEYYAFAIQEGYSWTDVYLRNARNEQPLYCPPPDHATSGAEILAFIKRELTGDAHLGTAPIGLAMLQVLLKLYPCGNG